MLERIRGIYAKLPVAEREMPAVVIEGRPYTWSEVLIIIENNEPLADQIQKKIEELYVGG